ncbi:MAG: carboxypeptidase regulatory-like domain-containing protein [Phycisphaerae bacterium]|nr:carboxypeptidase regulatory-like domain-containing protein [Saprospiraceae bacterium]
MKFLLPFALLVSVFVACNKDGFFSSSPSVNAAFAGRVMDEDGQAIGGAQVRVEGELVTTDENGVFRLHPMRVPSDDAKLMVTKIGYFEFSRAYYVEGDALQTVTIQLLRKEQIGTVNGASGGTIQLPGGARLVFPAGAFVDERRNDYKGTVRIFARRLDQSSPDFALSMPGDLRGINLAGDQQTLGNYGMVGVELQGQSGQELRIGQGSEVEIHLPIAAGQFASAPSEITLWHYDVSKARWIEEGKAQRVGNEYVGRVKHFTFWSFSTAFNLVELKGKVFLVDDQHPFNGAVVRLTMISDSTKGYALTNANGSYKGGVPMGETFVLEVLNACGEVLYSESVGPFDVATAAPDILVPGSGTQTVEVTGRLLDCTGAPIKNGYAQVLLGNFKWIGFTATDGTFKISKLRCDTSAGTGILIGFDLQNQRQSPPDTIAVPPNALAVGDLAVCDSLYEFIKFSLDYNDFVIAVPVGGIKDNGGMRTFLNGYSTAQQDVGISIEFANDGQAGTFSLTNLYVNTLTWNSGASGVSIEVVEPGVAVGDPIIGTFDGTFVDQLGVTHTLTGSYQVRRDY